jgi:predicted small metal-binding protein
MNDKKMIFECKDDDFMIQSRDKEEVKKFGRMHVKEKHKMDLSDQDLESHIMES